MNYCKPKSKSILCLDVGKKRIGLAYCDSLFITVNILPAVKREKNNNEIITIKNHIKKLNLTGFIVGLPIDEAGNMTTQAFDCKTYGEFLFSELRLPFSFVNEHSSTWESTNRFGVKKDKSGLIDSLSAKVILEQWIQEGPEFLNPLLKNYFGR